MIHLIIFLIVLGIITIVSILIALAFSDHWRINGIFSLGCGICWIRSAVNHVQHLDSRWDIVLLIIDLWLIVYFFLNGLSFLIRKHGWMKRTSS